MQAITRRIIRVMLWALAALGILAGAFLTHLDLCRRTRQDEQPCISRLRTLAQEHDVDRSRLFDGERQTSICRG